jgi:hypothetical protein
VSGVRARVHRGIRLIAALGVGAALLAPAPAQAAESGPPQGHVLVLGVPGLRWADITEQGTPAIWRLAEESATGVLSVRSARSRTCPSDGWLQLTTGNRARGPEPAEGSTGCPPLVGETPVGRGAAVEGWRALVASNAELLYDARLGLLAQTVLDAGGCVTAAGRGGAVGGADLSGRVAAYAADLAAIDDLREWSARCALAVFGSGALLDGPGAAGPAEPHDAAALAELDQWVAQIEASRPTGSVLLLAGVSEVQDESAGTHVAVASGPGFAVGDLVSDITRRAPYVELSDLAPTALTALRLGVPAQMPYRPWEPAPGTAAPVADRVSRYVDIDLHATLVLGYTGPFYLLLVVGQLLLYVVALLVWRRARDPLARTGALRAAQVAGVGAAGVVTASFLANLVPWWRSASPLPALAAVVGGFTVAFTVVALTGPWRRWLFGPAGAAAAVTFLVQAVDITTGGRLQIMTLAGYNPITAGRFWGFGNLAYAVFATGALLATAAAVGPWVREGRKRAVLGAVGGMGLLCVVLDGAARFGSDFGGVIALVPAFAVLGLLAAGLSVSWQRLALFTLVGGLVVAVLAWVDYLRPVGDRTHFGRFVADLVDGDAWVVVQRKLEANASLLTRSVFTLLVPLALLFVWWLLRRPTGPLRTAFDAVPTLRPGLVAVLTLGVIGGLVNDSGIAIPGMASIVAIPLAIAVATRVLGRAGLAGPPGEGPPESDVPPAALPPEPPPARR